jgi:ribosomal-protein-alanine N-acetyltransferase
VIQAIPEVDIAVDAMQMQDIDEVNRIERRSFSNPWPMAAYRRELRRPEQNAYFVLRATPNLTDAESRQTRARFLDVILPIRRGEPNYDEPHLVGYVGMWQLYDETHITTIAVDLPYRGRGYGELLLIVAFSEALKRGSVWLSLEVRVSNESAQSLYRKYGMTVYGVRPGYYTDNNEDALVMWSRSLRDAEYVDQLEGHRRDLAERLHPVAVPSMNPLQTDDDAGTALPPVR